LKFHSLAPKVCGMTITGKGQVTIPLELRKRHGLLPRCRVEFVDRPDGVLLLVKAEAKKGIKIRRGIPLARNDGTRMTAEEVAAMLCDG